MIDKYSLACSENFSFLEDKFSRICNVDPVVAIVGKEMSTNENGFLKAALTLSEALWLAKILNGYGIKALPVQSCYCQSGIGLKLARDVAQKYVDDMRAGCQEFDFSDAEEIFLPWAISKIAYGFLLKSEKMRAEDRAPAGMTLCIDKISGEIINSRTLLNIEIMHSLINDY